MKTEYAYTTRHGQHRQQQGIATILIVVLVGIALTATSLGMMHSIRSSQEKHVAVNAVTHAQTGAWAAAEALRRYLVTLEEGDLIALPNTFDITLDSAYGDISANNVVVTPNGVGEYRVTADIVNIHNAAHSSAALGIAVDITVPNCAACPEAPVTINFNDDLSISGGIGLYDSTGTAINLHVNGDITLGGASINPLQEVQATGKVTLGSGVTVDTIKANDDVTLANTVVGTVRTTGDLSMSGGGSIQSAWVNGQVTSSFIGDNGFINAIGDITINGGPYDGLKSGSTITISNSGTIDSVQAVGDIAIGVWEKVLNVVGMSNLTCVSNFWGTGDRRFDSISINAALNPATCPTASAFGTIVGGQSNVVTPMAPEDPLTLNANVIDVWTLKNQANFVLEWDATVNRIKVTVKNVNNIANDEVYYIGSYPAGYNGGSYVDYLCKTFDASDRCVTPAEPLIPICLGSSLSNGCISYNASTNTFTISPATTPPGIIWVNGNLSLSSGHTATTFAVTGNVQTSGALYAWAPNYAGYDEICLANATSVTSIDSSMEAQLKARFTDEFSEHYPTNFCDTSGDGTYTPNNTGNISFVAGGYDPNGSGAFSGGDINFGSLTDITGAVLAGNLLKASGATTVYGMVTAAGQGTRGVEDNIMSASLIIDLRRESATYKPKELPVMGDNSSPPANPLENAKLVWARYL